MLRQVFDELARIRLERMERDDALRLAVHIEELPVHAAFDERDAFVSDRIELKSSLERFYIPVAPIG